MTQPVAAVPVAPVVVPKPVAPPNGAAKGATAKSAAPTQGIEPVVDVDPIIWEGKVDGQQVKVKKSEADRLLSKGKFADKATQEAKEAIKRAKQVAEQMEAAAAAAKQRAKDDTDAWLLEHGVDPVEYAKRKLEQKVEEGKMTPEQREAADVKRENARLKAEHEKIEKQREADQNQQLTNQLQRRIENELVNAAKRAGMPQDAETFYAVYESFREAFELGLLPLDATGLMPHHADRIVEDAMGRLDGAQKNIRENALKLKGQQLLDFVGKEAVDAIMAARLEQIRSAKGIATESPVKQAPQPTSRRPSQYISPAEADEMVKKLGGR